jgi:hypothetical protein
MSSHCSKVSRLQGDAPCKGLNQIWGREWERGFVVESEGGWVCACVCVGGGCVESACVVRQNYLGTKSTSPWPPPPSPP